MKIFIDYICITICFVAIYFNIKQIYENIYIISEDDVLFFEDLIYAWCIYFGKCVNLFLKKHGFN